MDGQAQGSEFVLLEVEPLSLFSLSELDAVVMGQVGVLGLLVIYAQAFG